MIYFTNVTPHSHRHHKEFHSNKCPRTYRTKLNRLINFVYLFSLRFLIIIIIIIIIRLILLLASCPDKWTEVGNTLVTSPATQIKYFNANVYVALSNGQIYVYSRLSDGTGAWDLDHPIVVTLGADPVTSLLACARQEALLAACGPKIWRIDGHSQQVLDEHELHVHHGHSNQFHPDRERPEQGEHANLIAAAGTGLWVSQVLLLSRTFVFEERRNSRCSISAATFSVVA